MHMALSGRLALVTGGASGIGEAVCRTLAAEGATVVVADRQLEAATKVTKSLSGDAKHQTHYVDVGDSSSVEQLFSAMRNMSDLPLGIVVNCAGIFVQVPLVDCSDETFDEMIRINLRGTFLVTRAAAREMMRSGNALPDGGAAIVNISSVAAKSGWSLGSAYSAAKAGVVALTKSAAQELAAHGIRCNAVLPGMVATPMTAPLTEEAKERVKSMTALRRPAQPSEIAEAVRFLCLPTASSFVTGAAMEVTGGLMM
ncbi:(3R)-3-hydroxyacyl-CoA dehydrogenase-like [Dermacentor albipictus]|uniref:(3R)-3-hydroxyacyl-CoA dehydrogenase-like n=1 Tax=Dermacentor albipictus TaxID=60249 RepID=UPI0031FC15F0